MVDLVNKILSSILNRIITGFGNQNPKDGKKKVKSSLRLTLSVKA
jgi:hypothetical protein